MKLQSLQSKNKSVCQISRHVAVHVIASYSFVQSFPVWVYGCVVPGALRKKKRFSPNSCDCLQSHISTTRCQTGYCDRSPESSYIWPESSPQPASPKVGQSRSIRVLYTLRLELSLLGHERVLVEEASRRYVCDCQGWEEWSLFTCVFGVCVCVWYMTTAVDGEPLGRSGKVTTINSFGVPLPRHDSLHSAPLKIDWSTN